MLGRVVMFSRMVFVIAGGMLLILGRVFGTWDNIVMIPTGIVWISGWILLLSGRIL